MGALRAPALLVLAVLCGACAPQLRDPAPQAIAAAPTIPADFPSGDYERALEQGRVVYRIDPARSLVVLTVRREGSLARLGHDHVVASHDVHGYIAPAAGRADLFVALADLAVDEAALRAEAALDTQPSAPDIAATRANMLDKVLETERFPFALIAVNAVRATPEGARLDATITLHGVTRGFAVPARIESAGGEMGVTGMLDFRQSDFAIVPFSILGGAIRVSDTLGLRFGIVARRIGN